MPGVLAFYCLGGLTGAKSDLQLWYYSVAESLAIQDYNNIPPPSTPLKSINIMIIKLHV